MSSALCCEPGCTSEVLCSVHEYEKELRAQVKALHRAVIDGEPHVARGEVLTLLGSEPDE